MDVVELGGADKGQISYVSVDDIALNFAYKKAATVP